MFRIAVCDDDPVYLSQTESYLQAWQEETGIAVSVSTFPNGDALLEKAALSPFHIIFLDIMMPLLNGIDTARELRATDKSTKIVFLTSSPEFALDGYTVKASDYLLKPISYARMKSVLYALSEEIGREPESLSVRIAGGYRKIYQDDIEYLEAFNKKVAFCLKSGECFDALDPLYVWETHLTPAVGFFKCHRSYLVNLAGIDFFDSSEVHMKSGKIIPIARGCAKELEAAYFSVIFPD